MNNYIQVLKFLCKVYKLRIIHYICTFCTFIFVLNLIINNLITMIFNMTAVESKKLYEKLKAGIIEVKI